MAIRFGGSPLIDLQSLGQSVWLDGFHRGLLDRLQFARLVDRDGISGFTSSPAIAGIEDVEDAADRMRHVYEATGGRDGYVSIDVSPELANDADATVSEAQRLWNAIDKPNVMIKVPATDSGVRAIQRLIAAGININSTSIFGTRRYRDVAEAYISGLENRVCENLPVQSVASVAGFSLSHIDTLVDQQLEAVNSPALAARARRLRGRAAVSIARVAYQEYKGLTASPRWRALAASRAQTQRLLWASTGTKDARSPHVSYVNELIGRNTVVAMTINTLNAYRDHGAAAPTLERDLLDAATVLAEILALGIDLERVGKRLQSDALQAALALSRQIDAD
jgi:transaldolase